MSGRETITGRALLERTTVHVEDIAADPEYALAVTRLGGTRTMLGVPLLYESEPVGVLVLTRPRVQPFAQRQIDLVATFADQAAIAIENARLVEDLQARTRELAEALEQQTATSEVLEMISSSPGELLPVFNTILENAARICGAQFGNLFVREGHRVRVVAMHGPAEYLEKWRQEPTIDLRQHPLVPIARAVDTKTIVHVRDLREEKAYITRDSRMIDLVDFGAARTLLIVPMLKDDELIGATAIYRQEVQPFSDKQIELLSDFAKQAVIAIESTRLLNELREVPAAANCYRRRSKGHQPFYFRPAHSAANAR